MSEPDPSREAVLAPGATPVQVTAGTADVFALRTDGARFPLCSLTEGQVAFPAAERDLLVVARLDAALAPVSQAPDASALAAFVAAVTPVIPEVKSATAEQFAGLLQNGIARMMEQDAAVRRRAILADVELSEEELQREITRIEFSVETVRDPLSLMDTVPLLEVLGYVARADGFSIDAPTPADMRTSSDPLRLVSHRSGVRYRKVALTGDWVKESTANYLGGMVVDGKPHPVALSKRGSRYYIHAAGKNRPEPLTTESKAALAPIAYEFYAPLQADRPATFVDVLRRGLHGSVRGWVLAALMGLAVALLGLITPVLTNLMVGSIIPQGQSALLLQVGAALAIAAAAAFVFTLVQSFSVAAVSQHATRNMQSALWDRMLSLPASFFRRFSSGDLTVRVLAVDSLQNLVSVQVVTSSLAAIFGLVNLVLMFVYSPTLAVIALVFLLLTVGVLILGIRYISRFSTRSLTATRDANGYLVQLLRGIVKIRLAGAEDRMEAEYLELARRQAVATSDQTLVIGRISAWFIFAISAAPALFYTAVALQWSGGSATLTTAQYMAFTSAYGTAFAAISGLSNLVSPLANAGPTLNLLRPIMEELPETSARAQDPGKLTGQITLDDVHFRYTPEGPLVLRGLSLDVAPGEMVALVGPSGAGKSTITRLLVGFDSPEEGQVLYDGRNLADLDPTLVRNQMGVVVQEGSITRGSILRNILGATQGDEELAWQAAKEAALADDIAAMPMKMQTIVDPANVSGGQAQRILLARALVRKPRILILDEATSALDNAAQAQITEAMNNLQATRIVIAHRLSTIRAADRIIVIKAGVAVESGTYDELIAKGGVFEELVKRQVA